MQPTREECAAALAKTAVFTDLIGRAWAAIQDGESPGLPLSVLADHLAENGHQDAALALYGIAQVHGHTLEITHLNTVGLSPRTGEMNIGKEFRLTVTMRPPRQEDDAGSFRRKVRPD